MKYKGYVSLCLRMKKYINVHISDGMCRKDTPPKFPSVWKIIIRISLECHVVGVKGTRQ